MEKGCACWDQKSCEEEEEPPPPPPPPPQPDQDDVEEYSVVTCEIVSSCETRNSCLGIGIIQTTLRRWSLRRSRPGKKFWPTTGRDDWQDEYEEEEQEEEEEPDENEDQEDQDPDVPEEFMIDPEGLG